jgi:uncharacterized damage-inducible protein DinB
MSTPQPEPWLRGPAFAPAALRRGEPGDPIPALLQPAAHAFIMSIEDCTAAVRDLSPELVWTERDGVASIGFHLRHLAGATDRLLTYARGEALTSQQKAALAAERAPGDPPVAADALIAEWQATVDRALRQLAETSESSLLDFRGVGRAQLPTTVIGLLFHAAEHAARHTGQLVTTAKALRARR